MANEQITPLQNENPLNAERRDKLKKLRDTGIGWGRHICSYVFGQLCIRGCASMTKSATLREGLATSLTPA